MIPTKVKGEIVIVDIHTHILPGVDDGADDYNEAYEMLRVAAHNGTTDIVLTPHFLADQMRCSGLGKAELQKRFSEFKSAAQTAMPEVNLYFGAELFGVSNIEDVIEADEIITIDNSNYLLTEFDFEDNPNRALEITEALKGAGYKVIIAHPERYNFIQQNPRLIVPFLENGASLQLNAQSVLGGNGYIAQDVALSFLENNFAAVIASDSHSSAYRTPDLSEIYSFISSNFSPQYAEVLLEINPRAIIRGRRL